MKISKKFAESLASLYGTTHDIVQDVADNCSSLMEIRPELDKIFGEPTNAEKHKPTLVRSTDFGGTYGNGKEGAGGV